ncbi:DJ-1/PfpI family protein [Corynebacterium auris]|uniref:DJ-1/PfpI family protein n=1 Tax=Corynebacterium auris TaxID=44750 RepID=UPI0025B3701E|nr:DJ-1/PfpI family protein [Corynebacterium auris]WJY67013.1 Isonitrile hydratase [Corynebacterium auris]
MTPKRVSVVLFDGFELLDVTGPVEILARLEGLDVQLISPDGAAARSSQGVDILAHASFADMNGDVLLVPGGMGTRALVSDARFLAELARMSRAATITASVCTGTTPSTITMSAGQR